MPLQQIDYVRSSILSRTLKLKWVQSIYRNRERRTLAIFFVSLAVNLFIAFYFPGFLFYVTPLLLGVPHLFASFSFSSRSLKEEKNKMGVFLLIAVLVSTSYFLQGRQLIQDPYYLSISLSVVFSAAIIRYQQKEGSIWILTTLLLAFGIAVYGSPFWAAMTLLIGHNFVAFVYWYLNAQTSRSKTSVGIALSFLIFALGIFSALVLARTAPPVESLQEISWILFRDDSPLACLVLQIFLITQSLHYFIWLKAIPDYRSTSETPGGFQLSIARVSKEWGNRAVVLGAALALTLIFWWAFFGVEESRRLYVSMAAFHGLFEISVLFVLISQLRRN